MSAALCLAPLQKIDAHPLAVALVSLPQMPTAGIIRRGGGGVDDGWGACAALFLLPLA